MSEALKIPAWLRLYARIVASILLLAGVAAHVVVALALAAAVNPLLGLAAFALGWPLTGILALWLVFLWFASITGFWRLWRRFRSYPGPGLAPAS